MRIPPTLGLLLLLPPALGADTIDEVEHRSWDGQTASVACVWYPLAPPSGCTFAEEPNGTWTELPRGATRVSGEITFVPRTPAQQSMHVFVFGLRADGMPISSIEQIGSSPIAFDFDLATLPGSRHAVSIHGDFQQVALSTLGAVAELGQPFHAEMDIATP